MLAEGTFKHLKGGVWCCSRIAFEFLLNRSILWSWNKLFVLLDDNKLQLLFYFFILQSTHEVIYSISSKRNWILYFLLLNIRSLLNDTHGKIISLFKTSLVKSFFFLSRILVVLRSKISFPIYDWSDNKSKTSLYFAAIYGPS